jgi:gliding motility-associated-like protein
MKKIILILTIFIFATHCIKAQQIKRSTLTSVGKLKAIEPFRVTWTAGSCPGCNVLHPTSPAGAGYVRQGFQQPPSNGNPTGCPPLTPYFNIMPIVSPTCGTKFDMEYSGVVVPSMVLEWDFGVGAVPQTSTQLNPSNIVYTTPGVKIIVLKITAGGGTCTESKAKTVNVALNQVGFTANTSVTNVKCKGDKTGAITLSSVGGSGTKSYRWSNGALTQNINNVTAGRYSVSITDANGCSFSVDTAIAQPNSALGFTVIITKEACRATEDGRIELTPSGGSAPYKIKWSNGATTSTITSLNVGAYRATISDTNSCRIDTSFIVAYGCRDTTKKIYDVITPNKDGLNDKWIVPNIEKYPENEMFIYNRWGQLIYSTTKYLNDWAGTNQAGKDLPTGAYYYLIRLNDGSGTVWEGSVTVLR